MKLDLIWCIMGSYYVLKKKVIKLDKGTTFKGSGTVLYTPILYSTYPLFTIPALLLKYTLRFLIMVGLLTKLWIGAIYNINWIQFISFFWKRLFWILNYYPKFLFCSINSFYTLQFWKKRKLKNGYFYWKIENLIGK